MEETREVRALVRVIEESVDRILEHEDFDRYLLWLRSSIDTWGLMPPDVAEDRAHAAKVATSLALSIWNATPLPSHGFRPDPRPLPGRNEPCVCGSGRKYKRCCAGAPELPIDPDALAALVFERMPESTVARMAESGEAPLEVVLERALEHYEEDRPKAVVRLLEPILTPAPTRPGRAHAIALDVLCDAYNELGHTRKKEKLVRVLAAAAEASPMRGQALQRLAAMQMDEGDADAAFESLRAARRDDEDSPGLGPLEVRLEVAAGRVDRARERARWWLEKRRRKGASPEELQVLEALAADPTVLLREFQEEFDPDLMLLDELCAAVAERPVPVYSPGPASVGLDEARRQMGVSQEDIADAPRLPEASDVMGEAPDEDEDDDAPTVLIGPDELRPIEAAWREVFPDGKPFGAQDQPFGATAAWAPEQFEAWSGFLERTPRAFDSLDVLDDVATAVLGHGEEPPPNLLLRLVGRAADIVERAAYDDPELHLAWEVGANRPGLRSLIRFYRELDARGEAEGAIYTAELLLRLNPDDNHGIRTVLIDARLQDGDDEGALELCDRYPDDFLVAIVFGAALALFRLGRRDEAEQRLRQNLRQPSKIPSYLQRDRVPQPEFSPHGITLGGNDEAWLYRREMRATWKATPGAIPWLVKVCRAIAREQKAEGGAAGESGA